MDTRPELAVRRELHRRGRRYRVQVRIETDEMRCRPDIVFTRAKLVVFVDGCRWHCCPLHFKPPKTNAGYWSAKFARNMARDRRNDEALKAAGWRVLRLWEHESTQEAVARIEAALDELTARDEAPAATVRA